MAEWHYMQRLKTAALILTPILVAAGCGGGSPVQSKPPPATDTTPPRITEISGIHDGDVILTSIVFGATAVDESGIASFKLLIGGQAVVDAALASIVYSWDVRDIETGEYALTFVASDTAGNTATQTINVAVGEVAADGNAGRLTEVETHAVPGGEYALPAMNPALYNEHDKLPPTLIISGLIDEGQVWGNTFVSVMASDDTGVNALALLLDGYQVALAQCFSLQYTWDTTLYPDGWHALTCVVRDNGGTVGECQIDVLVDNATDHTSPAIDVFTDTFWSYHDFTGVLTKRENSRGELYRGAGEVRFRVHAADPQGVASLAIAIDDEVAMEVGGDYLEYNMPTELTAPDHWFQIKVSAADTLGNSGSVRFFVIACNSGKVHGRVLAANGQPVDQAEILLFSGSCSDPAELDPAAAVGSDQTEADGRFSLGSYPAETYTLLAKRGSYEAVLPVELVLGSPVFDRGLTAESAVVLWPRHGTAEPNTRLAIVTGTSDNVPAAFNTMFTTKFHKYVRPDGDYIMPELIDLIDGDGQHVNGRDFMSLLSDPSALYRYCYIMIESGNAYEEEWLADPQAMAALRGWVEDGGRLALTGQAYDFGEQLFPAYIDFAGSAELDGLGTEPEAHNAAQLGQQAVSISLEDHFYYGEYSGNTMQQLLDWRGLTYVPSICMPAEFPRIADQEESVFTHLRMIPADAAEASTPPLAVTYRPELGRVVQICFPIEQASQDAGQMTALFLDILAFST